MTDTVFANGTVIQPAWLNDVNTVIYHNTLNVRFPPYSAVGDGITNDTAAFLACKAACLASGAAMVVPPGTYLLTANTNLGATGFQMLGQGKPTLLFTGSGTGLTLDAGGSGAVYYNMVVENFILKGNPSITDIFYHRGASLCNFKNLEAREGTGAGFKIRFGVCNKYENCFVSTNLGNMVTLPAHGWYYDNDGSAGTDCSALVSTNCTAQGLTGKRGFTWVAINRSYWYGGASEFNSIGIDIQQDGCSWNSVYGMDLESNTTNDMLGKGETNSFFGASFQSNAVSSPNIDLSTAKGFAFYGGNIRWVNVQSSSANTSFFGTSLSDNGGLGFQGTGVYSRTGCTKYGPTGVYTGKFSDMIGEASTTFTPSFISSGGGTQGAITNNDAWFSQTGGLCAVSCVMNIAKGTLGAGTISITGFPVATSNLTNGLQYLACEEWDNITLGAGYTTLTLRFSPGSTTGNLFKSGTGVVAAQVQLADFTGSLNLRFSGILRTN